MGFFRSRKEVYLGDDNALTLTFNARNEGEGGAYEAELYVVLPPEADYSGIARNNEVRRKPTASTHQDVVPSLFYRCHRAWLTRLFSPVPRA